jgi:hypothetical protein
MNTPRKPKRASAEIDRATITRPAALFYPVSDHTAAYIGLIVTEYGRIEKQMIDVFQVLLGIESGEAATLTYYAITAPKTRWQIARTVLEKDHMHIRAPTSYDELIDEFHVITDFRNLCVHSVWGMDSANQPWVQRAREPEDTLRATRFLKSQFDEMLAKMHAFRDKITDVSEADRRFLEQRWLERSRQVHDNSSSAPKGA